MGHCHELEIRRAPERRHFARSGVKGIRDYRDRRYPRFLEDDRVEQTARRARTSISDAGNCEVDSAFEFGDLGVLERRTLMLMHEHFHFHAIRRVKLHGDCAQYSLGVLLRVLDKADAQALKSFRAWQPQR